MRGRSKLTRNELEIISTLDNPPEDQGYFPILSAPIGPRTILAEVRALQPPRTMLTSNFGLGPTFSPPTADNDDDNDYRDATPTLTSATLKPIVMPAGMSTGGTMSKGGAGLKSIGRVDQLDWLTSVKVGSKRGSNSSGSGVLSRLNSKSRPPSMPEVIDGDIGARQRSGSLSRAVSNEKKDGDGGQSLQDESVPLIDLFSLVLMLMLLRITSVLTKLAASKITLEKVGIIVSRGYY